ncbi:MAG: hypothetical protein JSR99_09960 [Proteobacteria bacterium]|nr:hypothetical protein [Pseudomonadota bacterium]
MTTETNQEETLAQARAKLRSQGVPDVEIDVDFGPRFVVARTRAGRRNPSFDGPQQIPPVTLQGNRRSQARAE